MLILYHSKFIGIRVINLKVSTKGRYGLRAMVDLAANQDDTQVSLKSIAERQGLSENYLEQMFSVLKKSGLVKSVRGAQGGYFLAKPADKITVGDILRVLEGPVAPVDCISTDVHGQCCRESKCATIEVWKELRDKINEVIDSYTLANLVDEYNKKNQDGYIFYI